MFKCKINSVLVKYYYNIKLAKELNFNICLIYYNSSIV